MKLLQELLSVKALNEGFMGFSVGDSDSAFDLWSATQDAVDDAHADIKKEAGKFAPQNAVNVELAAAAIEALKKGLQDKGNAYNTHGTLNVAMVMDEKFPEFRKVTAWKKFAGEVAAKLKSEADARKDQSHEYTVAMHDFAKRLEALSK